MKLKGVGGHQSANSRTDEWLTPPEIIRSLGEFDLDPCSPITRPWDTAKHHYTTLDHGLLQEWFGRVWLNPPYGRAIEAWMQKMSQHNNGISLVYARTETQFFQQFVFPVADSILFLEGRITFCNRAGMRARFDGGAPSVLIAYGEENGDCLASCGLRGRHVPINNIPVIVITASPSWKNVVSIAITRLNGAANLDRIYSMVETIAPDKVAKNKFWREKIRQQLQQSFQRISKGHYSNN